LLIKRGGGGGLASALMGYKDSFYKLGFGGSGEPTNFIFYIGSRWVWSSKSCPPPLF